MILRYKKLLLVLISFTGFLACENDKENLIKEGNKDIIVKSFTPEAPVPGKSAPDSRVPDRPLRPVPRPIGGPVPVIPAAPFVPVTPVVPVKPVIPGITNEKFVHNIVIEQAVGVYCPTCPRMLKAIEELKKQSYSKNINVVSFHAYRSLNPFENESSKWLRNKLRVRSYPTAYVNRTSRWDTGLKYSKIERTIKSSSPIGIKISSSGVSSSRASVDVKFQFNESYLEGLSYRVYFLQNGCPYIQHSYKDNEVIKNITYNHKNILLSMTRKVTFGSITKGQQFKNSNILKYTMYKKPGETSAQTAAQIAGADILVMVLDSKGNIIQSAQTKANTTMEFQIKR